MLQLLEHAQLKSDAVVFKFAFLNGQEPYDQWCYSQILIFKSFELQAGLQTTFYKRIFALLT